jgi:ERCC4-type nuclease
VRVPFQKEKKTNKQKEMQKARPSWLEEYLDQRDKKVPTSLDLDEEDHLRAKCAQIDQEILHELEQLGHTHSRLSSSSSSCAKSSLTLEWEAKRRMCEPEEVPLHIQQQCKRVDRLFLECFTLLQEETGKYRGPNREECICLDGVHEAHASSSSSDKPLMRLQFHNTEGDLRRLFSVSRLPIVCDNTSVLIQNDIAIWIGDVVVWRIERKAKDLIPSIHSHLLKSEMKTLEMSSHRMCRTLLLVESDVQWAATDADRQPFLGPKETEYDILYQEARSVHSKGSMHFRRTDSLVKTAMTILLDVFVMLKDGCHYYEQMKARPAIDPCTGYAGPMDAESLNEEYLACAQEFSQRKFKPGDLCKTPSSVLVRMLARIHGISEEMSRAIQHAYPSMLLLWQKMEAHKQQQDDNDEDDAYVVLADMFYQASKASKQRKIGKQAAQRIEQAIYSEAGGNKMLFMSMLECIPGIGREKALAIWDVCPSFHNLLSALSSSSSSEASIPDAHILHSALCGESRSLKETRRLKRNSYQTTTTTTTKRKKTTTTTTTRKKPPKKQKKKRIQEEE